MAVFFDTALSRAKPLYSCAEHALTLAAGDTYFF
jgi:hypothetical protein